jgi:prepilin-type processing-associated H-X9-DG protein
VVTDGENNWLVGLAARHGKGANRRHGWANFAFFDGHVTLMETYPLSTYMNSAGQGAPGDPTIDGRRISAEPGALTHQYPDFKALRPIFPLSFS